MKKTLRLFVAAGAIASLVAGLSGTTSAEKQEQDNLERKIVVFEEGALNESAKDELISKFGGVKVKDLDLVEGKSVLLPPHAEKALARQHGVKRIDDDVVVEALGRGSKESSVIQPAEVLPWGVDRIDAEQAWAITGADTIKVAVIDTGIDLSHPDLKENVKGGYNAIRPDRLPNDDNGHGTHVAGIIGGLDNNIGVVGVGPQIDLYAVKSLNRNGSGYLSDIIEGIDWSIANGIQVINMSLGTNSNVQSFHDAIIRANQAGIIQVAAAGNDGAAVDYPAAYTEVIAVSAIDSAGNIPSWSSRGSEVDFAAPGVNVYSTYKGQTYKTLNGTSMASPHVAGTAALVLSVPERCDADLSGTCSPSEVAQQLAATAEDLGIVGYDPLYGNGLINALKAVTQ